MGLVYHLECPNCKKKSYIGSHVSQMKCSECDEGTIVNTRVNMGQQKPDPSNRFVFSSKQETRTTTCPGCKVNFSTPAPLFRGKVFCPSCHTEVKLEGVTQI